MSGQRLGAVFIDDDLFDQQPDDASLLGRE